MQAGDRLGIAAGLNRQGASPLSRFFQRAALTVVAVVAAGAVLMFSAVLLAVLLVLGVIAWAWLWWRTRPLRRQGARRPSASADGLILEGEVIREVDETGARRS